MKEQKNIKWLYIIISILLLSMIGYFIFDIVFKNESSSNNASLLENGANNNTTNEENKETNTNNSYIVNESGNNEIGNKWMEYILSTDINSIQLNYCVDDPSNENGIPTKKTIDIKKDDLNRVFTEMKKGDVYREYFVGLGGPCMDDIYINYTSERKEYELDLVLFKYIDLSFTKDKKVLSYLKDTKYIIRKYDNIDLDTHPFMYEYSYNEEIVDEIIESYTK